MQDMTSAHACVTSEMQAEVVWYTRSKFFELAL